LGKKEIKIERHFHCQTKELNQAQKLELTTKREIKSFDLVRTTNSLFKGIIPCFYKQNFNFKIILFFVGYRILIIESIS
jgi:hypothetical protein